MTHNKKKEDGSNWRSRFHNSKKIPQAMRNMKNSILEEPLIHLENLDKKWCCYEWRRWWSWKEDSYHERNKDEYSIFISWYCFVMHIFIFNWYIMHDRMFALMTSILLICMWLVSSPWFYTTLHCYLSRMKPLCWHIGLVHNLNVVLVEMEGI